ncbi:RNA-guided endonuclease InsQ/TnpB family protein [Deinococcus pimensis]|uniref:RNA-guided endonuclease InsQ/TnpB family protein n=1 Tax=Deinococcus pimensis TaxID=309888 RepID=UPI0004B80B0C|nr:RNA-guided endonuclease TnpB family protein [Deinococcus pimensis]
MPSFLTRTFKYRVYPTARQERQLEQTLELCRQLYNATLEHRTLAWRMARVNIHAFTQMAVLPEIRAALPEYRQVHSQVLQNVVGRVDRAFLAFFRRARQKGKPGYPRVKLAGTYRSITYPQPSPRSVSPDGHRIYLPKIGLVRIKLHRPALGHLKTLTVLREHHEWYVLLICTNVPVHTMPATGLSVGIDVGTRWFFTTSDGEQVSNRRPQEQLQHQLTDAQRELARRTPGSGRYRKAHDRVVTLYRRSRRQRAQWHHEEAKRLVQRYDLIAHERLNVEPMTGSRRAIQDVAWSQFFRSLTSKAEMYGRKVIAVHAHNTSLRCRKCGKTTRANRRTQERFLCVFCGHDEHADFNAAWNILARALPSGRR